MKTLKFAAELAVLLALVAVVLLQYSRIDRLASDVASLREQLAQAASLREENEHLATYLSLDNSSDRDQLRELLRLRGEVSVLTRKLAEANSPSTLVSRDRELQPVAQRGGDGSVFASVVAAPIERSEITRYEAAGGSKIRIEGTSALHDWQAESPLILGNLEVGPGFPTELGQAFSLGRVEARGTAVVLTKSLTSRKENGEHYENKMDENMYKGLKADMPAGSNIVFEVTELTLKEVPKAKDAPYVLDSRGEITVAGVTKKFSMPVNVFLLADGKTKTTKLKITGTTRLKMTDFKIDPATLMFVAFKMSPDVTIKFEWMLAQRKPVASASK